MTKRRGVYHPCMEHRNGGVYCGAKAQCLMLSSSYVERRKTAVYIADRAAQLKRRSRERLQRRKLRKQLRTAPPPPQTGESLSPMQWLTYDLASSQPLGLDRPFGRIGR